MDVMPKTYSGMSCRVNGIVAGQIEIFLRIYWVSQLCNLFCVYKHFEDDMDLLFFFDTGIQTGRKFCYNFNSLNYVQIHDF